MTDLDPMTLAEKLTAFMDSDTGLALLTAMNNEYNQLHHKAEDFTLSMEHKAYKVERAAGIKWCIDWMMTRKANLERGAYKRT
jgi:hypothetical protein